jgi:DNA-binding MarR family transcriptional regulator
MMQELQTTDESSQLPPELGSAQGKLVYLYLETAGSATVDDLGNTLAMKKIDVLSVLNSLSSRGLIEERDAGYAPAS